MAKKDKDTKEKNIIPDGMQCFKKNGGGSLRFTNRIIKSGQKFWAYPEAIPNGFMDSVEKVAPDNGAVILQTPAPVKAKVIAPVELTFAVEPAMDSEGIALKKGNKRLYNVVDEEGKAINEKPLSKAKATELAETLSD